MIFLIPGWLGIFQEEKGDEIKNGTTKLVDFESKFIKILSKK